jgi:hypothetical protein
MVHTDEFIFPNITRVYYCFGPEHGFIINSQCTPITRFKTRVYTWICYRGGWLTHPLKPLMRYYTRKVITQDVEIMRNHGENHQRFQAMEQRSTGADEIHIAIERIRAEGARERGGESRTGYEKAKEFWI